MKKNPNVKIKMGDTIQWSFSESNPWKRLAGKTFTAKVLMIDNKQKHYGVYSDYGNDLIPFDQARLAPETFR